MSNPKTPPLLEVIDLKMHFPVREGIFLRAGKSCRAVDGVNLTSSMPVDLVRESPGDVDQDHPGDASVEDVEGGSDPEERHRRGGGRELRIADIGRDRSGVVPRPRSVTTSE